MARGIGKERDSGLPGVHHRPVHDREVDLGERDLIGGVAEQVPVQHDEIGLLAGLDRAGLELGMVDVGGADGEGGERGREVDPLGRQERLPGPIAGVVGVGRDLTFASRTSSALSRCSECDGM